MSRVAEYLGVPHSTVISWLGGATPTKGNREAIAAMLSDGKLELTRKKSGPRKGAATWSFNAKREHVYAVTKTIPLCKRAIVAK